MLEKAIAGWLTNATEKAYQPAFVSLLIQRGETVLYSSRHRPLEQGKDVVTHTPSGRVQAYQLKGGTIDITRWRRIHGELDDLVSMPPRHPSISPGEPFDAYLVTNGRIVDEVLVIINEYNTANAARGKGWARLQVIQGDQLLGFFQEMGRGVLPLPPEKAKTFFNTYCSDGRDLLVLEEVEAVIRALCFAEAPNSRASRREAVSRGVLVASFLFRPYEDAENHFALLQGWTLLALGIARFLFEPGGTHDPDVLEVLETVFDKLDAQAATLRDEALARKDLVEGDWRGDGGDVYRARVTLLLGAVCAGELIRHARRGVVPQSGLRDLILRNVSKVWLWGEGAVPYCACIVKCLELLEEQAAAEALLRSLVRAVVQANRVGGTKDVAPLPTPYIPAEEVLLDLFELDLSKEKIDRTEFLGQSWTLHSLVMMCARRGMRSTLEPLWRDISRIQCMAFEPDGAKSFCQLRTEDGVNRFGTLEAEQSWAKLVTTARNMPTSQELWPLWGAQLLWVLLVAPNRWREPYASLIDALGQAQRG